MSLIAFRTDTSLRGTVISNHTPRSAGTAFSKVDMGTKAKADGVGCNSVGNLHQNMT